MLAELDRIEGDEEPPPVVPRTWLAGRLIGEATVEGRFVDVGDSASLATLRVALAANAIHHGLDEIDAATIRLRAPRAFTQQVSRYVYEQGSFAGIRYRSRLGDDVLNWAVFGPLPTVRSRSSRRPLRRSQRTIRTYARRSNCSISPSPDAGSCCRLHRRACRQRRRGIVQLVRRDVGVAADGREVGVAEVGGDEAGIAGLLT